VKFARRALIVVAACLCVGRAAWAQVGPTAAEAAAYKGLHAAAHRGDTVAIQRLAASGALVNATDGSGRTPLHVAAFARQREAIRALVKLRRGDHRVGGR
jgi:uncharacterized protein